MTDTAGGSSAEAIDTSGGLHDVTATATGGERRHRGSRQRPDHATGERRRHRTTATWQLVAGIDTQNTAQIEGGSSPPETPPPGSRRRSSPSPPRDAARCGAPARAAAPTPRLSTSSPTDAAASVVGQHAGRRRLALYVGAGDTLGVAGSQDPGRRRSAGPARRAAPTTGWRTTLRPVPTAADAGRRVRQPPRARGQAIAPPPAVARVAPRPPGATARGLVLLCSARCSPVRSPSSRSPTTARRSPAGRASRTCAPCRRS